MKEAFLYCWTDQVTHKLYVGVHKGIQNDGYICSSKKMLEEYHKRPEDFKRKIIAEGQFEDMISLETAILCSVNAKINPVFYNMHNGDGNFYNKGHTQETKEKIKSSNTGYSHTAETRKKLRDLRLKQNCPRTGRKHDQKTKDRISEKKKGNVCHKKSIIIGGIFYDSYKAAAAALGCNYNTITKRVKRGLYA